MSSKLKPQVVVSRCLGFSPCRYNAQAIPDKFVDSLKDFVEYITACPEVDIGMETPRKPIRLVSENNEILLYQPETGKLYTEEMLEYSSKFLENIGEVDGFILKGKSPSCGLKDVKVYLGKEKVVGSIKGSGIFASKVLEKYPYAAIEEEGRLTNLRIREHFLTKLYIMFRFRQVKNSNSIGELVKFQSHNKYLLMAYNQKEQKLLGKIVANHDKLTYTEIFDNYRQHLGFTFARLPRYTSFINTLMHIFGYFSDKLSAEEKKFVLGTFEKYRDNKLPLSVPLNLLRTYVIKYNEEYLLEQSIWEPYPEDLMDMRDSGNGEE